MSTTSSTLTSVLSALGGSNGIDVTSAVNAILYADRAPERAWQAQQSTLANQTAAIQQLESESSAVSDALSALQTASGALNSATVTTSNGNLLTATAASGTASSSHLVTINNLASTGSWYSDAEANSSTALADGTSFDITAGGVTTTISVASGNDTLDEIAASINSQSLGVTANVITDSTGARLALVSTTSGAAGDFTVSNSSSLGFTRANTGTNASLTVDGVPISSASNTVTSAISGVTLNLTGATNGTEISLKVAPDTGSITTAVSTFVTAYNTLIADVNSQFKYNSSTNTAGVLQSDSAVQSLQSALLNSINYSSSSGAYSTLTSLGITVKTDGTLKLDTAALSNAVAANNAAVTTFFQGTSRNGFAASLITTLNTYTDTTQGAFTIDLKSIASEYQSLSDQTDTLELYLASQQTLLTAQYNAADIAIQQLPQKLKQIQALLNPNQTSSS